VIGEPPPDRRVPAERQEKQTACDNGRQDERDQDQPIEQPTAQEPAAGKHERDQDADRQTCDRRHEGDAQRELEGNEFLARQSQYVSPQPLRSSSYDELDGLRYGETGDSGRYFRSAISYLIARRSPRMLLATCRLGRLLLIILAAASLLGGPARASDVTVFAAASLKNALDDAVKRYETKTGVKVVVSYAASSALAKQIEAGAPADIFFSADLDWMDELQNKNLIDGASRQTLLGNTLILIAPKDSTLTLPIEKNLPLLDALGPEGKLAMANVDSVPAGRYGRAALIYFGVWEEVAPRVAQADNVRAALSFVAKREAPLGIVYATDAKAEPEVRVVGTFPEESHPKILYPVALLARARPEAGDFLRFLLSPEAAPAFKAQGFSMAHD
jgi:molybdate transport system substrate-binding protein